MLKTYSIDDTTSIYWVVHLKFVTLARYPFQCSEFALFYSGWYLAQKMYKIS